MNFRQARSEYLRLRHAYRSGQIPPDQFEKQVNSMVVHSKGQMWMIGVKSGRWYRREGKRWIEDLPEIEDEAAVPQQEKTSGKNRQNLEKRFKAMYAKKPRETAKEKSFRQMTVGFSILFIILLALLIAAGLMMKGVIETPSALSSILETGPITAEKDNSTGGPDAAAGNSTLESYLVLPANGVISNSGKISLEGFLYTENIRGSWLLRDTSNETLVANKNGSVRIFSTSVNYDLSGTYSFINDNGIRFQTDAGSVEAEIWIDAGVLTLVIDNHPLVYDRID